MANSGTVVNERLNSGIRQHSPLGLAHGVLAAEEALYETFVTVQG